MSNRIHTYRTRAIAAGSIAALAFVAAPVSALAATNSARPHSEQRAAHVLRVDRSRDTGGTRHIDTTRDRSLGRGDRSLDG